jgi:hypothetical protein
MTLQWKDLSIANSAAAHEGEGTSERTREGNKGDGSSGILLDISMAEYVSKSEH